MLLLFVQGLRREAATVNSELLSVDVGGVGFTDSAGFARTGLLDPRANELDIVKIFRSIKNIKNLF